MAHDFALDFRSVDAHRRMLARLAELVSDLDRCPAPRPIARATSGEVATRGYVTLAPVADGASCERLLAIIDRLLDAGLPAVFVLMTDAALALGAEVERSVSQILGRPYTVIRDVWAWRIPRGASGWPPHRGVPHELDRRAPELVNTWVALSAADVNRSCMHFVPLDDDPHYPGALDRIDFEPSAVSPAPLEVGEALAWNANILHWGGRCAPDATGPRYSCSFSLEPASSERRPLRELDAAGRLDLVLEQIATYGVGQPDVTPALLDWARASCALRSHLAAMGAKAGRKEG